MSTSRRGFLSGHWISGAGDPFHSSNPATGEAVWRGRAATESDIRAAVAGARMALEAWSDLSREDRVPVLMRFADALRRHKMELAEAICLETGKPFWESQTEVDAMAAKIPISLEALAERRRPSHLEQAGTMAATRYKPIGVMAVFGPFNMPGHLPNGHIIPALLAGNTIVFKPSELTPGVGQKIAEIFHSIDLPTGVVNLVQGDRDVGAMLAGEPGIDGILFTGSVAGGLALAKANVEQPGKMLALEMGGNNPLIVWEAGDLEAAAYLTIQSAFITSGQRCSCARRLIVPTGEAGGAFLDRLIAMTRHISVGPFTQRPEPFMGPVISDAAAEKLLAAEQGLVAAGAIPLLAMRANGPRKAMLTPGVIDVTSMAERTDEEHFGPLLQVIRVPDFASAIIEANRTSFGLAAGLLSDNADLWNSFYKKVRAGVTYWNRQTTGGSSQLPFGGVGQSGNHRPSGYFATDYCSYPVASMEIGKLTMPAQKTPGLNL